jgi:hypothetical protein
MKTLIQEPACASDISYRKPPGTCTITVHGFFLHFTAIATAPFVVKILLPVLCTFTIFFVFQVDGEPTRERRKRYKTVRKQVHKRQSKKIVVAYIS